MATKEQANHAREYLRHLAKLLEVYEIVEDILESENFFTWTGSGKLGCHHYGTHGLIIHTYEVVQNCMIMRTTYEDQYEIDKTELFLATFFHDVGKLYDYKRDEYPSPTAYRQGGWTTTEHKRNIHHITRSVLIWNKTVDNHTSCEKYRDDVTHAILAHHGLREWRSPVSPNTRVAWLLHLCDGISARMNDVDTQDRVK
jgi:3'-5' exoribonuclease